MNFHKGVVKRKQPPFFIVFVHTFLISHRIRLLLLLLLLEQEEEEEEEEGEEEEEARHVS